MSLRTGSRGAAGRNVNVDLRTHRARGPGALPLRSKNSKDPPTSATRCGRTQASQEPREQCIRSDIHCQHRAILCDEKRSGGNTCIE